MKNRYIITLVALLNMVFIIQVYGQSDNSDFSVEVYAKYFNKEGMQLRIFPQEIIEFSEGVKYGFIIERADKNSNNFQQVGITKAISMQQWDSLVNAETDTDKKEALNIVKGIYNEMINGSGEDISQKDVRALLEIKKKQNFMKLMLVSIVVKYPDIMNSFGLSFTDKTIDKGKSYKYHIRIKKSVVSPVMEVVAKEVSETVQSNFTIIKGDSMLSLQWDNNRLAAGFDIERYDKQSNKTIVLNKGRIFRFRQNAADTGKSILYEDKHLINYREYTYHLFSYDVFGNRLEVGQLTASPIDLTPPPTPLIESVENTAPNKVVIKWKMDKTPSDLKGFIVSRSYMNKGAFLLINEDIIDPNTHEFTDTSFYRDLTNYYVVSAVDTAGNISSTYARPVILTDTLAPVKPIIDSILIDSMGIVRIFVKRNNESDLMGYKLYFANGKSHEFTPTKDFFIKQDEAASKIPTQFMDTVSLNTLTKHVYYRVKALDFHYNQSEFSDIYTVNRPDTIAPVAPVIESVQTYEDSIKLTIISSSSRDLKAQYIYRKLPTDSKWTILDTLKNDQQVYIDKDVVKGTTYHYTIRAIDSSNIYSEYALAVNGAPIDRGLVPVVSNLNVSSSDNASIKLSWEYETSSDIFFIIYRKTPQGHLVQYTRTQELAFEDIASSKGSYSYAVKVYNKNGRQSILSEAKIIEVN